MSPSAIEQAPFEPCSKPLSSLYSRVGIGWVKGLAYRMWTFSMYWMVAPAEESTQSCFDHCDRWHLVGGLNPSEKYESQLGWLFPIYGKIIQMFQTTNQTFIDFPHSSFTSGAFEAVLLGISPWHQTLKGHEIRNRHLQYFSVPEMTFLWSNYENAYKNIPGNYIVILVYHKPFRVPQVIYA